jgi:hypothetical protein
MAINDNSKRGHAGPSPFSPKWTPMPKDSSLEPDAGRSAASNPCAYSPHPQSYYYRRPNSPKIKEIKFQTLLFLASSSEPYSVSKQSIRFLAASNQTHTTA